MKQELKTIALVISITIKEMDQRETKGCIINLHNQLPTHSSVTAGWSAPSECCAVWMPENAEVLPVQNHKQPVLQWMEAKPPCPRRRKATGSQTAAVPPGTSPPILAQVGTARACSG